MNHPLGSPPPTTLPILAKLMSLYKRWHEHWQHLPKEYRQTLGSKIDSLFIEVAEAMFIAGYLSREKKLPYLQRAIGRFDLLKFFTQALWEVKAIDDQKYISLFEPMNEVGSNLGGWYRQTESFLNKTSADERKK